MKQLKEVCAYIRVSTGKQEELSPDSQLRLIKEYAQAHDMLLTHVYMEGCIRQVYGDVELCKIYLCILHLILAYAIMPVGKTME